MLLSCIPFRDLFSFMSIGMRTKGGPTENPLQPTPTVNICRWVLPHCQALPSQQRLLKHRQQCIIADDVQIEYLARICKQRLKQLPISWQSKIMEFHMLANIGAELKCNPRIETLPFCRNCRKQAWIWWMAWHCIFNTVMLHFDMRDNTVVWIVGINGESTMSVPDSNICYVAWPVIACDWKCYDWHHLPRNPSN